MFKLAVIHDVYKEYLLIIFVIFLVDCEWDEWGDWSTCSLTCGGGEQTRSRVILRPEAFGGVPCVGPPEEARACNEDACPGKTKMIKFITIYNKLISLKENIYTTESSIN